MDYLRHAFEGCKPFFALVLNCIMYIMFPEKAFLSAFYAVGGAMIIDVITKWHAIKKINNCTLMEALKRKYINSNDMFNGTKTKIYTYTIIFILAGLSYRVSPIAGASVFLASFVYSILFLRECQSIVENLADAGGDVGFISAVIKKKQKDIMIENAGIESVEAEDKNSNDLGC